MRLCSSTCFSVSHWVGHAAPITSATLNTGQNVQHKMSSRNSPCPSRQRKEMTEVLAADLHEKYALDNVAEDYKK